MKSRFMFPLLGILILICITALGMLLTRQKSVTKSEEMKQQSVQPSVTGQTAAVNQAVEHTISLSVTDPTDAAQVETATISVKGKTVPNADVSVNDTDVKANASGVFAATITLSEGENPIMIVANDDAGNAAEKEMTVTYIPAQ